MLEACDKHRNVVLIAQGCKWSSCAPTRLDGQTLGDNAGDHMKCFTDSLLASYTANLGKVIVVVRVYVAVVPRIGKTIKTPGVGVGFEPRIFFPLPWFKINQRLERPNTTFSCDDL